MTPTFDALMPFAVLAYAALGGVFLAFSDFIMRALSLTKGAAGIDAMQSINREVYRWVFMTLFLGLAAASAALAAWGVLVLEPARGWLVAASGLVYLSGCFAVTVVANVPMNERLARLDRDSDAAQAYWVGEYLPRWTRWNTVRAVACIASAALLLQGLSAAAVP